MIAYIMLECDALCKTPCYAPCDAQCDTPCDASCDVPCDDPGDCNSQVKDLGVIFDRVLSLRQHVSYTSKTCLFHIRNISRIKKYIPQDTSVVLVKSLVMSRLDY